MNSPRRIGVLLCNIGGPASADLHVVQAYLKRFFSDRAIIPVRAPLRWMIARGIARKRAPLSAKNYKLVGGRSPLLDWTAKQAAGLEARLNARATDAHFRCAMAMRYAPPFTEQAVDALDREGYRDMIVLPLYPQESCASTGSALSEVDRILEERNWDRGVNPLSKLAEIREFHLHPTYIDAVARRVREGLARFADPSRVMIVFSAHGLPKSYIDGGDPYQRHIEETTAAVVARLGAPRWRLGYQSRVGPQEWIGPDTLSVIDELAAAGEKELLIVPIAFVSDHIETLHEIGMEQKKHAAERGVLRFECTEGLNDSPRFIEALAELVESALAHSAAGVH